MTTISARIQDQVLTATILPKLACNNRKSVKLHVNYDSGWNSYAKSALFYTDQNPTVYPVVLNSSGDCIIPHEVLADEGYLYITIQGVKSSTGELKSTTPIMYKILPGTPSLVVSPPSPGVYEQLLTKDKVLEARLSIAEAGVNVDSEVADIRAGASGHEYASAGDAVRAQLGAVLQSNGAANPMQPLLFDRHVYYRGSNTLQEDEVLTTPVYNIGNLTGYTSRTKAGANNMNIIGARFYTPIPVFSSFVGDYVLLVKINKAVKDCGLYFGHSPDWNKDYNTYIYKIASLEEGYNVIPLDNCGVFNDKGHDVYNYMYINFVEDLAEAGVTDLEMYLIKSDTLIGYIKAQGAFSENARKSVYAENTGCVKPSIASYMSDVMRYEDDGAYRLIDTPTQYRLIVSEEHHIEGAANKWFQGFCLGIGKKKEALQKTFYIDVKSNNTDCTIQNLTKLALHNSTSNWNGVNISKGIVKISNVNLSAYADNDELYLIFGIVAGTSSNPQWNANTCDISITVLEKTNGYIWSDNINPSNKYITCWGDSLTSLGGWTTRLQELCGMIVHNAGTGGENVRTITARQGADVIMINNITIPASTTPVTIATYSLPFKTAFGHNVTPLLQGSPHVNPVKIGDIEGTLSWTGNSYSDTNGTWTFTRSEAGVEKVINRPTAMTTAFDREKNNPHLMIIFMGQNGGYNSDNEELINLHRLMISHAKAKHTIILGLSSGSAEERADYEAAMKKAFGRYFISLREYLSKYGLDDAGLTPTAADTSAMATGKVPPQLLADDVHYTSATKTIIGNMIFKLCCELGIFKD